MSAWVAVFMFASVYYAGLVFCGWYEDYREWERNDATD